MTYRLKDFELHSLVKISEWHHRRKNKINTFTCDMTYRLKNCEQHSLVKYHNGIIEERNKITHSHVT